MLRIYFYIIYYAFIFLNTSAASAQNFIINDDAFTSSNLPIIVINTHGQTILNEPKIMADMGIIFKGEGNRNNLTDPFNDYNGKINIEIRGSSSQMFDKKQYGFDTVDSLGNDNDVSLLGFPGEHSWILSAPYSDKALIRDALTYDLTNKMGRYASRSKFCEVVINGDYKGVYVLFEKVKRGKNRVNISKITPADSTGDALTGGYILQIDRRADPEGWLSSYPTYPNAWQRVFYQYNYPKTEDLLPVQKKYIQNYILGFEGRMNASSWTDTSAGYPALIDINSFVDYFIVNEMTRNVDVFRLSTYLCKEKDSKGGGRLTFGPVWDFNLGYGNADYNNAWLTEGWQLDYETNNWDFHRREEYNPPFWAGKIFSDKNMKIKIAQRWKELRQNELKSENIFKVIDSLSNYLTESQIRNFTRWPILGFKVWPNYYIGKTYTDEIEYLKSWIIRRFDWMDSELGALTSVGNDKSELNNLSAAEFMLYQNYPNPFNPVTKICYSTSKASHIRLWIYDILGKQVSILEDEFKPAGNYSVNFEAGSLPSGIYFCSLQAGEYKSVKKLVLAK